MWSIIIYIPDTQIINDTTTCGIDWYFDLKYSQIESNTASDVSEVALGSRNLDDDENWNPRIDHSSRILWEY